MSEKDEDDEEDNRGAFCSAAARRASLNADSSQILSAEEDSGGKTKCVSALVNNIHDSL